MASIGTYVIYIIMACAVAGAIASIRNPETGLGKEFIEGLHSIGPIFIPVAGIMAAIPYLSEFIRLVAGPLFAMIGADPSIAATTVIAVDMGGYQLADTLAQSRDAWMIATIVGFMSGATIIFSIPVGLAMLAKADHKYMALGIMSGILSVPIGVFIACALIALAGLGIRPDVSTTADASYQIALSLVDILRNLLPLIVFCVAIALGLRFAPDAMITGFLWFGRLMYAGITLVLVASIVEYFTGFFTTVFGSWGFDPIIADEQDQFRALEIAGYIGIMLAGAFPMVYLLTKYLAGPMEALGARIGVSPEGAAGLLAATANILAMYRLVGKMQPRDKVLAIAFAVCAAFTFGDHLAFSANFQPSMILPLILGKLFGGAAGFLLAIWLSVPKAEELASLEMQAGAEARPVPAE
ncbi:ethanolamine utilization protein EutH [Nitratireductor aquimarinus]|uniref:ethanolamine utilization protein EutH n=1 Tax=Alphaproteobacteria TaxID=28211 RepID=UPI0019D3DCA8|nr:MULTISPECIES: ethanolamine utilization protein EutH [Alphaproteobacteria]MBN7758220.1 ethanolamine utilization protein EutH [Nitratireductor aquimarinus]MBY6000981.1 ethanolamine utilization protein EutH [Tritonibacter mobilis]MBY6023013.1 ethanolamine utilization protein EutH [Nitratireductor sp. DP7N14-4]